MKIYDPVKRILDIVISLVILILLLPLLLLITVLLILDLKGNPFFIQERPGKDGKIFKLIKFRTMTNEKDKQGNLLPDTKRITRLGKFLRMLSLDELPELINVLKGDMSLVGPRPLLVKYLPLYNEHQARRHEVKPGITGLAQINGRNLLTWEERFDMDVYYVDHYNFFLDIKILFLTLYKVIKREGINYSSNVTMKPFTGSPKNK